MAAFALLIGVGIGFVFGWAMRNITLDKKNDADLIKTLKDTVESLHEENAKLKKKAVEDSWKGEVDRMSGAFDQNELDGRDGWQ